MSGNGAAPGTNPPTKQGRVVVTAKRSAEQTRKRKRQHAGTGNGVVFEKKSILTDDVFSAMPSEILLLPKRQRTFGTHLKRNTQNEGLTCLNGARADQFDEALFADARGQNDPESQSEKMTRHRVALRSQLRWGGVVESMADARQEGPGSREYEFLAAAIGGVQGMFNGSNDTIYAGIPVQWDLPRVEDEYQRKNPPGIPSEKILAIVRPYIPGQVSDRQEILEQLAYDSEFRRNVARLLRDMLENGGITNENLGRMADAAEENDRTFITTMTQGDRNQAGIAEAMAGMLSAWRLIDQESRRRVFGVALNTSRPGESVDVFICGKHA
jgi:hypothetical protein